MNILKHYQKLINFAFRGDEGYYAAREYMGEILIEELEEFINLQGKKVLDVGGERGEFCKVLAEKKKCKTVNLEPNKLDGGFVHKTILGTADKLPFKNESFDIVLYRGVLQHIPTDKKLKTFQEIHRVLEKNGIVYLMIPPWYNPLSGQNIKPFQYFPFKIARHFRNSVFFSGIKKDSLSELGLWPMTVRRTLKLVNQADFKVIKTVDILFRLHFFTRVPVLRELFFPSVGFILRKNSKHEARNNI